MDVTDSLAFPAASHMWNNLGHADDSGESSSIHCHLIQSHSKSGQIQASMGLISDIENDITTIWQTITKAIASTTQDLAEEIGDNVDDACNSALVLPTQQDGQFLPTLSNDIQNLVGNQQLHLMKSELGMSISIYNFTRMLLCSRL